MSNSESTLGVVFDMDGVLIDSHAQHHQAWLRLSAEIGKEITPAQFDESFGMRNVMCIPHVFKWADPEDYQLIHDLGERKEEFYREILAEGPLEPLAGVRAFTQRLTDAGIPGSVGSSTSRLNIEMCLQATGLDAFFGANYTGAEDVENGKPAPDVFLEAARKIDRAAEHCMVIEDAHVGVEAGLAGGMRVLALTTTHAAETFAARPPHQIVNSLEEVTVADVLALWAERKLF